MRYLVDGDPEWSVTSSEPDTVYWLLDSMGPGESHVLEDDSGSPLAGVARRDDGSFDVEFRESSAPIRGADILVVHQALVRNGSQSGSDDYATTGLSIATSLLDHSKREKRLGLPRTVPPTIRWGEHAVSAGDVWELPDGRSGISVRVEKFEPGVRHGIALSAAGGPLEYRGESLSEVIFWPSADDAEFEVSCPRPGDRLRITTVYLGGKSRIDRWGENAGMWVEHADADNHVYHCNYYATSPPTFEDLRFSVWRWMR